MRILISISILFSFFTSFSNENIGRFRTEVLEVCDSVVAIKKIVASQNFELLSSNSIFKNSSPCSYFIKVSPIQKWSTKDFLLLGNTINNYEQVYLIEDKEITKAKSIGTDQLYDSDTYLPSIQLNEKCDFVLIHIKSNSFIEENIEISTQRHLFSKSNKYIVLYTIVCSVLLLLGLYVLVFYIKSRQTVVLKYSLYIISILLATLFISNFGRYFFWGKLPFSNTYLEGFMSVAMVTTYTLFAAEATYLKYWSIRVNRFNNFFICCSCVLLLLSYGLQKPTFTSSLAKGIPIIGLLLLVIMVVQNVKNNNNNNRYFLFGFLFFLSGVMARIAINSGIMPHSFSTETLIFVGILLEMFIFSIVVVRYIENKILKAIALEIELDSSNNEIIDLKTKVESLKESFDTAPNRSALVVTSRINSITKTPLSKREIEVLNCMMGGAKYQEISDKLHISINTLKTHVSKIYSKLEINNRVDAINKVSKLLNIVEQL